MLLSRNFRLEPAERAEKNLSRAENARLSSSQVYFKGSKLKLYGVIITQAVQYTRGLLVLFSGIGFALAVHLLQHDISIHVCLGCRNEQRAEAARSSLLSKCPDASVSILLIDVAKPASVYRAAADVRQR